MANTINTPPYRITTKSVILIKLLKIYTEIFIKNLKDISEINCITSSLIIFNDRIENNRHAILLPLQSKRPQGSSVI